MAFPDRIERTISLTQSPAVVWAALTTAQGLGTWLGDKNATIDLRPGGAGEVNWSSGDRAELRVERVEEPTTFGFTWRIMGLPADDERRTYVEFTLEPDATGTRLTVIESGFAQLSDDIHSTAHGGNTQGWISELADLVNYLDAA